MATQTSFLHLATFPYPYFVRCLRAFSSSIELEERVPPRVVYHDRFNCEIEAAPFPKRCIPLESVGSLMRYLAVASPPLSHSIRWKTEAGVVRFALRSDVNVHHRSVELGLETPWRSGLLALG